jgi:hypothetical protein
MPIWLSLAVGAVLGLARLGFGQEAAVPPPDATGSLDGLWAGSWGGGERDGVVFQPVLAEMVIHGDEVEIHGFRQANRVSGTIKVDRATRQLRVTPKSTKDQAAPVIVFQYDITGDKLTLTDQDKVPVYLERRPVTKDQPASLAIEFVMAQKINDAGELLTSKVTSTRTLDGRVRHHPEIRSYHLTNATVLLVQEANWKKLSMAEARKQLEQPSPVVLAFRNQNDQQGDFQHHELWKSLRSPEPDSPAAGQMFLRMLRPGTMIFVLPGDEQVPLP